VKVIEVHDLIQGIMGKDNCFPDFRFGYENQQIIAAMEHSSAQDRRIHIGDLL